MARETFFYPEAETLFKQLEDVSQRSSISRGQAFEDFLHVSVCALGTPLMEDEYLQTVERHKSGTKGKRGIDKLAEMFAMLIHVTDKTRADILGDLFQGSISYGEKGQFLTPECICDVMAQMNLPAEKTGIDGRRSVNDPCCGSGRMLLSAAKVQPNWHFVGQDVDLRCVRMTAINLGIRNHYGHVVCGNSLGNTSSLIYETGRVQVWGNAIRKVSNVPLPNREPDEIEMTPPVSQESSPPVSPVTDEPPTSQPEATEPSSGKSKQLKLF